jgi:hypothetical protein
MNARDILFKTSRFNLSRVSEHFINPCCFGEDLAAWLQIKLANNGAEAGMPGQEDWGWYLQVKYDGNAYFLGISGNGEENSTNVNAGKWRIIVKKNLSIWQRISGMGTITVKDGMFALIEKILRGEPDIRHVHHEEQ